MYCPSCGDELPAGSAFCPGCGGRVVPAGPNLSPIEPSLAWVFLLFFGLQGIHRFYLGGRHIGWGIAYLLTGAFCGIGWLVDLCCLSGWIEERNRQA